MRTPKQIEIDVRNGQEHCSKLSRTSDRSEQKKKELAAAIEVAILPLIASAREEGRAEGAKEMKERAALEAEYYARHSTTAKNITREIRALSLEGSKT